MFLLYDLIFIIFAIVYLPYVLIGSKWHAQFKMRFGFLPEDLKEAFRRKKNIWIHAVSVGEVLAVKRFVQELQRVYPEKQIVISTVTTTGNELAKKQFPDAIVIFAPLDFSGSVRSYIHAIQPKIYIATETEIWPNIFHALHHRQVPILQVNGRISDKSYPKYKAGASLLKHVLNYVQCFCMQTEEDARRVVQIGASSDRVCVVGNMKFDDDFNGNVRAYGQVFFQDYGPVLVAGSTHPGEEEIVLNVFKKLRAQFADLSLILAPRHIERVDQIEPLIVQHGFLYERFSRILEREKTADDVILVDTIGHLRDLYAYGTVVFIGKSLIGRGGQNIIEPASFGRPVVIGPYTENFRAVVDLFKKTDAVVVVESEDQLYQELLGLLDHPNRAVEIGENGKRLIESQRGAVSRTCEFVRKFLS